MQKPMIAVCRNNHLYNAAYYSECPICQKKKEQNSRLFSQSGTEISRSIRRDRNVPEPEDTDLDKTVNLFDDDIIRQVREKRTDIRTQNVSVSRRDNRSSSSRRVGSRPRCLAGWLVCLKGKDYGMSFQLLEGQNFISLDDNGYVKITKEPQNRIDCFASITGTMDNRFLIAPFRNSMVLVNGKKGFANQELLEHQVLQYRTCEMMFIPFMGVHYNWS